MLALAFWTHDLSPFLLRFGENLGIRWYGLAYLAGFIGAFALLYLYFKRGRSPFGGNTIGDLITYIILGVIVGGRLGFFVLYQLGALMHNPLVLFRIWEGGMASHGGFIGVILSMLWWCKKRQAPFFHISDLIVTVAPVGLFFGRVANFINGELWGKPAVVAWAVIFKHTGGGVMPRHPSQLYEAALEGLVLFAFVQWRFWRSDVAQRQPGRLSGEFLIGYALVRAFCELFREPDEGVSLILGLSRGTFYSVFLIIGGTVLIVFARPPASRPK